MPVLSSRREEQPEPLTSLSACLRRASVSSRSPISGIPDAACSCSHTVSSGTCRSSTTVPPKRAYTSSRTGKTGSIPRLLPSCRSAAAPIYVAFPKTAHVFGVVRIAVHEAVLAHPGGIDQYTLVTNSAPDVPSSRGPSPHSIDLRAGWAISKTGEGRARSKNFWGAAGAEREPSEEGSLAFGCGSVSVFAFVAKGPRSEQLSLQRVPTSLPGAFPSRIPRVLPARFANSPPV
ncbi:hypothetical protein BD311DRAFT_751295 [Dichomitus squalens]|uniref:Uncharacterized protein n=1 Tax=Dichomitus squalens TaxID=114155 RepID=A0A4V6MW16_9APHY|nr:hypothetical protein BD311DRAFT_751295 [Dichomitus squalens]